ncbi:MAG: glycosyl hydrolase 53 family protein, partial [Bacteroidota bacterium]
SIAAPEKGYLEMGSKSAGKAPDGSIISVNSRYLMLDNEPWLPVMGEFHFSRYPEQYWEEEILKMKAGGIQILSTYIFWIHHEEIEGHFDWSGRRNLRRFVELCAKHGLYVFPRIGPWAHGEVRNGGFPDWLLTKGATRVNDSTYLSYVRRYYNEIGKQLKGLLWKEGGPIIGIQIENEYSNRTPNGGAAYISKLKQMAIDAGIDVPLYTVTGWDNAVYPEREVIPVFGGYPDEPWGWSRQMLAPDPEGVYQFHVATPTGTSGILQGLSGASNKNGLSHYPKFTVELGGGMELTYHRRVEISADDIASMALTAVGSGVNLLGYYMYHGGSNPEGKLTALQESQATGYPNDVPVVSYDFQAPLREFGQMNESFRKLKLIHQFIQDFGRELATTTAFLPDVVPSGPRDSSALRLAARTEGNRGYIFFNNYLRNYPLPEQKNFQAIMKLPSETITVPREPITIPKQSYFFWPVNMNLGGALLKYATAQPFAKIEKRTTAYYFFTPCPSIAAEFAFAESTVASYHSMTGIVSRRNEQLFVRETLPSTSAAIELRTRTGKEVCIILLSRDQAYNSWKVALGGRDHLLITQADLFVDGDTVHLRSRSTDDFSFLIFPKESEQMSSSSHLQKFGDEGIFGHYTATVKPIVIPVTVSQIGDASPSSPVRMGKPVDWRPGPVASAPDDSAFDKAGVWQMVLPEEMPSVLSDVFLDITYAGDVGRLYEHHRLLDDNFFNGTTWEVGLKQFGPAIWNNELELKILPLRKDAPIYLPENSWPEFADKSEIAAVKEIATSPEYEVKVSVQSDTTIPSPKFVLGADISALDAPGRGRWGTPRTYQEDGKPGDELTILLHHGWKAFRLRIFLSPVRRAPNNTLENAIPLAKRIKAAGATFLLCLHYSDTWADPQHQEIPTAWQGLSFDTLERRFEEYSCDVITQLKNAGAMPDWVQIGNEITRGTEWPMAQLQIPGSVQYAPPEPYVEAKQWDRLTRLLKAGIRGVKSAAGDTPPRIAIHIDQGANWPVTKWFFDHLEDAQVDYDIIAESFYPPWHHGTLEGLWENMNECAKRYNKDFLVVETGYDSSRVADNEDMLWPVTPEGRLQYMVDIVNTVKKGPRALGVMYWAPERDVWNPDGTPGPAVMVLDSLSTLRQSPASHAPAAVNR